MSMSVCLSVRSHISETASSNFERREDSVTADRYRVDSSQILLSDKTNKYSSSAAQREAKPAIYDYLVQFRVTKSYPKRQAGVGSK